MAWAPVSGIVFVVKNDTPQIVLIAHNLRSCHNVGSLLRTADGLGISKVYLTGYTPYPAQANDTRLPHLVQKITKQIHKTALGAETTDIWEHSANLESVLSELQTQGFHIAAIEQNEKSVPLPSYKAPEKIAVLVGREVEGIEPEVLASMDTILEIPMFGTKESFNVVQAAAMALYHCRFVAQA
jgi:23S rRNA (guanosine2251-2'-O)-methyltransferase